jgi:hypothetical protein
LYEYTTSRFVPGGISGALNVEFEIFFRGGLSSGDSFDHRLLDYGLVSPPFIRRNHRRYLFISIYQPFKVFSDYSLEEPI